jgi:hypothetical protein
MQRDPHHIQQMGMRVADIAEPGELVIAPTTDNWLLDHRPTWTVPALPMMSVVDLLANAAHEHTGRTVHAVRDVRLGRWILVPGPVRLRTEIQGAGEELTVSLLMWREASTAALSRFETVATGTVSFAEQVPPPPPAPLPEASAAPNPYAAGRVFHGPAFQYLTSLRIGAGGATGVLDAARGSVPRGLLHQGLLDAATHVIPHDELRRWSSEIGCDVVGYPHRLESLLSFVPLPDTGEVQVEARFAGFDGADRSRPMFDLQLFAAGRLLLAFRLADVLVPKGPLVSAPADQRRTFMGDRRYAAGIGLSVADGSRTWLSRDDVDEFEWLPGTVAELYGLPPGTRGRDHLTEIAVRDHVARLLGVHPSTLVVSDDLTSAWPAGQLENAITVRIEASETEVWITTAGSGHRTATANYEGSMR